MFRDFNLGNKIACTEEVFLGTKRGKYSICTLEGEGKLARQLVTEGN